jgi:hypothetical protein
MSTNVQCPTTYNTILTDLIALVLATRDVIDNFFPPIATMAPNISKMGYKTSFPMPMYMVLLFMQVYPTTPFDPSNPVHLNNLKDIYLSKNTSWQKDPFISNGIKLGII